MDADGTDDLTFFPEIMKCELRCSIWMGSQISWEAWLFSLIYDYNFELPKPGKRVKCWLEL